MIDLLKSFGTGLLIFLGLVGVIVLSVNFPYVIFSLFVISFATVYGAYVRSEMEWQKNKHKGPFDD